MPDIVGPINIVVGDDFISIQTETEVYTTVEILRFHNIDSGYRFFYNGLQAILTKHPNLEDFDFGDESGTTGLSGG